MELLQKIAPLFAGWDETLIWSVLEGHMGYAITDHDAAPTAAQVVLGDFCFFAGKPSAGFAARAAAREIVPQNEAWSEAIEQAWGERAARRTRYAIRKDTVFSRQTLCQFAENLPAGYTLRRFDAQIYEAASSEGWSQDFCACFRDSADFLARGIGFAALHDGRLVSGASSYSIYSGGLEIEIDTHPDHRRRGLALACGARLILEALDRNLYPSWDAFDLRSVALAEKLGYALDFPYAVYMLGDPPL